MLLASALPRVSLAQLRAMYKPRRFRELTTIEILVDGQPTELEIITSAGEGCVTRDRRWLRCHTCGGRANVVGYVLGFGWSCRRCLGWRSRGRPASNATNMNLNPTRKGPTP